MLLPARDPWWVLTALAVLAPAPPAPSPAPPAGPPAVAVLHQWDRARAAAWASGDVSALRALYTADSPAGRADVALLTRYLDRGLRVRGLTTQVFSVTVLANGPGLVRLRVVDRLAGGVACARDRCAPLPRDHADRRTITLRRGHGRWLVADVRR
jgi:hypothetical protein